MLNCLCGVYIRLQRIYESAKYSGLEEDFDSIRLLTTRGRKDSLGPCCVWTVLLLNLSVDVNKAALCCGGSTVCSHVVFILRHNRWRELSWSLFQCRGSRSVAISSWPHETLNSGLVFQFDFLFPLNQVAYLSKCTLNINGKTSCLVDYKRISFMSLSVIYYRVASRASVLVIYFTGTAI